MFFLLNIVKKGQYPFCLAEQHYDATLTLSKDNFEISSTHTASKVPPSAHLNTIELDQPIQA